MHPKTLFANGELGTELATWLGGFTDCVDALNNIKTLFEPITKQTILGDVADGVTISGPVYIGKGAKIHPHVAIQGPVYIGENADIRPHAFLRNHAYIGANCVVGHGADIKNTICLDGSKMQINAFVGDSILGACARVASGAIISNRKFNQTDVYYKDEHNHNKNSGRGHLGAIVGRHARIGANCVVSPGTMVGAHTWIGSGCVVSGKIPDNKFVTLKQEIVIQDKDEVTLASGRGEWEPL